MRARRGWLKHLVGLFVLAMVVSACGQSGGGGQGTTDAQSGYKPNTNKSKAPVPTELVIGIAGEPPTLDQPAATEPLSLAIAENIFDGLVRRQKDGSVKPWLAERWETSPDGLAWTFYLRKNVKFQNGEPVNAEAVKFSLERMLDPNFTTSFKSYWSQLDKIEVVDETTVRFRLKTPNPLLLNNLPWHLTIVPPKYTQQVGKEFGHKPIGSGPYKLVEWIPDQRIVFEAVPGYWGGEPEVKRIVWKPIPNETVRVAALLSGEVHVVGPLNVEQVNQLKSSKGVHIESTPTLNRDRLVMRNDKPPFNDPKVRQAVQMAIDVDAIIATVLQGQAVRLNGPLGELEWGLNPNLKPWPYDPQKAKLLLAEAGYPNGLTVTFDTRVGQMPKDQESAEAIASYLDKVGIKTNIVVNEWGKFTSKSTNREIAELHYMFWSGGGVYHAAQPFNVLLACKGASAIWNPGYFCNPDVDTVAKAAFTALSTDQDKAKQLYFQAQEMTRDWVPFGFLWQYTANYGISDKVQWTPYPGGDIDLLTVKWNR